MSAAAALARGRAAALALMVDTCTVKYQSGTAFNNTTGLDEPTYTTRFTSPCKVQERGVQSSERDSGGHESTLVRTTVHLPMSAGAVYVDDIVTITVATYDAQLTGRTFRVLAPAGKSWDTARRVEVEAVVA